MRISDTAIRRPVATAMIALALILFGFIGIFRMRLDLFPNVKLPMVVVATIYPGAGPLEVESEVTNVLEERLGTVPSLKEITSRSAEGISVITLQLEWGTNLDALTSDIRDRLNQAEVFLPKDVQKPFIFKFDVSMMPVLNATLYGDISDIELAELAEEVSTRLQRVEGVAAVGVAGAKKPVVQINLDMSAMAQYGITYDQIALSLKSQNINFPVGSVQTQGQKFLIRVVGQYDNLDQIRNTIVGRKGLTPITIRQLGEVVWQPEADDNWTRSNLRKAIFMWIQRRPDANTVIVSDKIKNELKKIKEALPSSVKLEVFWDSSEPIKRSIKNVLMNLFLGGILAIFVLYLFLRRLRKTIMVAMAIPVSIFFALFFMYLAGFSINILSLAGLAIAVGMVVDNGIVVFESIYRHRELGESPLTAASIGTQEVGMAITASTLTTLAVFFPLLLIQGLIKVFFQELAWAIIFSLLASLGVALTLIPMLASKYLKTPDVKSSNGQTKPEISSSNPLRQVESIYAKILHWAIHHPGVVLLSTLGLFLISLAVVPLLNTEFIPEQSMRYLEVIAEMPKGTTLTKTDLAVKKLETYLMENWSDVIQEIITQGGTGGSIYQQIFGEAGSHYAELYILLKKHDRNKIKAIESDLRKQSQVIPGLQIRIGQTQGIGTMLGAGAPVQIEIIGHDLRIADSLNELLVTEISQIPGIVDIRTNREKGKTEIQLIVDRNKSATYGLTPYQIGAILRTQIEGSVASSYRIKGQEYDMKIRLKPAQRQNLKDLLASVLNSVNNNVLLKNIVQIKTATSPLQIHHKNTARMITITANIVGVTSGKMGQIIKTQLSKITPPPGFEIKITGAYEEMINTFKDIGFALLIAIILVFMVMAGQFESFRDPFIILFTIPLSLIGVIWGLLITQTTLSIISGIGILVLVGIVVNNGIVYIDYVNRLRRNGMDLKTAVITGGRVRLRPILMTALTTIFGLLPLALKIGEGAELWSPLGRAVIFGMLVATFLTLIFIPTLYMTFEIKKKQKK